MKLYPVFIIILLMIGITSCKKILEVKPQFIKTADQVYSNDVGADSVVVGLYFKFANGSYNLDIPVSTGLSSDELQPGTMAFNDSYIIMFKNQLLPVSANTNSFWSDSYNMIFVANSIIEGVQGSTGMTVSGKTRCIGEAKFMRAFAYFYLINFFGDVPLITTTDYKQTMATSRTPVKEVYQQILQDLLDAENKLTDNYPTEGRVRANKWAAKAMLSRVYLYTNDWNNAKLKAAEVIGQPARYSLGTMTGDDEDNAQMDIFHSDSKEAILQIWNNSGASIGYSTLGDYAYYTVTDEPNTGFANAFEAGDKRKVNYILANPSGSGGYRINKYRLNEQEADYKEFTVVLRLAEQYLIKAEALVMSGQISEGIQNVNVIRKRAGLSALSNALSKDEALKAIEQERRIELCFEWADRWLNLKRLGHLDQVMILAKPKTWKSTAALYPIPQIELQNNNSLVQNPGYTN